MKLTALAMVITIGSACSAATNAIGAITGGTKPQPITVVNNVTLATPAAPIVNPAPERKHRSETAGLVTGGVSGAVIGGLVAASLARTTLATAEGALVGAGLGAAVGYMVRETAD